MRVKRFLMVLALVLIATAGAGAATWRMRLAFEEMTPMQKINFTMGETMFLAAYNQNKGFKPILDMYVGLQSGHARIGFLVQMSRHKKAHEQFGRWFAIKEKDPDTVDMAFDIASLMLNGLFEWEDEE